MLKHRAGRERGNILIGSLTVVLAVSVTGASLMQASLRKNKAAGYEQRRQQVFHMAESCVSENTGYLRALSKAPNNSLLPVITTKTATDMFTDDDSDIHKQKLSQYSMNCTLSGSPDTGGGVVQSAIHIYSEGEMVQDEAGYGLSGDLSPKVYYWLTADGSGPEDAGKTINAVVSAQY